MNAQLSIGTSSIRQFDGLFSLNDLHQASGGELKNLPAEWLRLEKTKALVAEVKGYGDSHIALKVKRGGNLQGTFACKELVVAYATWISPQFFLKVIRVFLEVVLPNTVQLATPEQKQHIKSLVNKRVITTGLHHQKVWTAVQEANGFNKLDNLTPVAYSKACAYFNAEPIGLNADDWQAAPKPIAAPAKLPEAFLNSVSNLAHTCTSIRGVAKRIDLFAVARTLRSEELMTIATYCQELGLAGTFIEQLVKAQRALH